MGASERGGAQADFLLARAAQDLGERLSLVKRRFALAADFGSPGPHGAVALAAGGQVDCVVRIAPTGRAWGPAVFLPPSATSSVCRWRMAASTSPSRSSRCRP